MEPIKPAGKPRVTHEPKRKTGNFVPLPALEDVDRADPEEDARRSIESGDYRFAGIWSFSLVVPGVPTKLVDKYGKKGVVGTGCIRTAKQQPLYDAAHKYVRRYNHFLSKELSSR